MRELLQAEYQTICIVSCGRALARSKLVQLQAEYQTICIVRVYPLAYEELCKSDIHSV